MIGIAKVFDVSPGSKGQGVDTRGKVAPAKSIATRWLAAADSKVVCISCDVVDGACS